jgi:acetolactate synthase-1/2/3 large subunit
MSMPITKHNFLVHSAAELLTVIPEAFRIAVSGRPGPVLIDIPKDVQIETIEIESWPEAGAKTPTPPVNDESIKNAVSMITNAKRPLLYIGGGIIHAEASELLRAFAKRNSIPVVTTLMGLGAMKADDPLYLGMLGMHGAKSTNAMLYECDLLLAFGVRFDDRATGKVAQFCPQAKIIHADIDRSEFGKIKRPDMILEGDIGNILESLLKAIPEDNRANWIEQMSTIRAKYPSGKPSQNPFDPVNIIKSVNALVDSDTIVATDVGQHQMWVAQSYPFSIPRTLLTSGGLGTMGFGFPTAIGAAYANPGKKIVCFSGDGSILMNIQELATLADLDLNVTIILLNNGHLGLVRQQQELFYNENYIASRFATSPNFKAIAEGFGIKSYDLANEAEPIKMLAQALAETKPCFVNVPIPHATNVLPMVPPNCANCDSIGE